MTKTVARIPSNVPVMLDANIVVYAFHPRFRHHQSCKKLLERGVKRDLTLHISVDSASDVIHRTMVLELLDQGVFTRSADAVSHLKQTPQTVQTLMRHRTLLRDMRQMRINIFPLTYRDLHNSKRYRQQYGLMTKDSLIVAVMDREKIKHLATNDRDFERIPNIAVRMPD